MNADAPSPTSHGAVTFDACCRASVGRYLRRHRDVATCGACGMLLLAYGNDRDFDETRKALTEQGAAFATDRQGGLRIIAKARAAGSARRKPR